MTLVISHMSVSVDGFVAGPDQSLENPLGIGGPRLHRWHFEADEPGHEVDAGFRDQLLGRGAAYVMGRNMFGPVRGGWDSWAPDGEPAEWRGWWGEEPPYHAPVFVLTHHPRPPLELQGTTFHFVTDGVAAALDRAREAAGPDGVVDVAGGASTVQQVIRLGALDELLIDIAPALLGSGARLLDGLDDPGLEVVEAVHSPWATHIRYRLGR
ncbi:dihydrofolate reductase [Friedmanniella endophytica]|uniref:Dihydrofolate reductase n=1 Tax=Microlunatus kandeliicorticis TaxID=1759536 RepID=A0A7W3IPI5_9ACTN|nr:dihydrofolate reductase family protein [Microlunatus kandeliicorticis]MBA8792815.1 dihydrofolate reductase [Microlunatus kandeliicorticis]